MVDLNKVDPIDQNSRLTNQQGAPTTFFSRQWQLIRQFVNGAATNITSLVARVTAIEGTNIGVTAPITGGGLISGPPAPIGHADSGVTADTYGDATHTVQVTVDEKGHVTDIEEVAITFPSGGSWSLVGSHDFTGTPQATYSVNNLSGQDILVIMDAVGAANSGIRFLEVSVDNGSTWLSASGDYVNVPVNGVANNQTNIALHGTASTVAKTGGVLITAAALNGVPKFTQNISNNDAYLVRGSLSPINAVRLSTSGAGNMTSGTAYVLQRG